MRKTIIKCDYCGSILKNNKIWTIRHSPNFSWDKNPPWDLQNFFFCSNKCKSEWKKYMKKKDNDSLPYLAELDESMNYCEYFIREKWNIWTYKKEDFTYYPVNGLWDYKSFDIKEATKFKQAFIKHFWYFKWFKLHNRYNLITN